MSRGRILSPRVGSRHWQNFCVYDMEWVPGTLELRLIGTYDGEHYRRYWTVESFLAAELNPSRNGMWYYAHAGGLADINFILPALVQSVAYSAQCAFSGSSAIAVTIAKGRHRWHLLDSFWLLKDKLENIGKWIGLEKGDGVKHSKEWYATAPISELEKYNYRDCVILWKAIREFQSTLLDMGGSLKRTQAACAMDLFRRRYLKTEIRTSEALNNIARQSYTASRVEVLASECGEAKYYDINSSFPHAMTYPQPGNLIATHDRLPDRLMYEPDKTPFLARVTLHVPDCYLPPLPFRHKDRVFFPMGRWSTWLTSVDLELMLLEGVRLVRLHEVLEFEPFYDLASYATDLYTRRMANDDPFQRIAYKYLLNSLYGKFAERGLKQKLWINPPAHVLKRLNWGADMLLAGAWIETIPVPVPHEHVPISSHITAIARRTLYRHLANARDIYYCDTDGFATTDSFDTGGELGDLKLEKLISSGRFFAPKVYSLDGTTPNGESIRLSKAKGFSIGEDRNKWERLVKGLPVDVERMSRARESFRAGRIQPLERVITKQMRDQIPKRFTYPDGSTRPWHMNEIEQF